MRMLFFIKSQVLITSIFLDAIIISPQIEIMAKYDVLT